MRKFRPLDELDKTVMHSIVENPGRCTREYLKPHLLELSEPAGRCRIKELELRGLVKLEKTKREVKVWPSDALKMVFAESRDEIETALDEIPLQGNILIASQFGAEGGKA